MLQRICRLDDFAFDHLDRREAQFIPGHIHQNVIAVVHVAFEDLQRQRVLQIMLDGPLERTRAVDRVEAFLGQERSGLGRSVRASDGARASSRSSRAS